MLRRTPSRPGPPAASSASLRSRSGQAPRIATSSSSTIALARCPRPRRGRPSWASAANSARGRRSSCRMRRCCRPAPCSASCGSSPWRSCASSLLGAQATTRSGASPCTTSRLGCQPTCAWRLGGRLVGCRRRRRCGDSLAAQCPRRTSCGGDTVAPAWLCVRAHRQTASTTPRPPSATSSTGGTPRRPPATSPTPSTLFWERGCGSRSWTPCAPPALWRLC
mmetsp:Transcript_59563/g.171981  ORF Transcript_59563/g.171981 Transcript_59563/m.171981 type:complete len:222 (+) Transcript_59563:230-895(+)